MIQEYSKFRKSRTVPVVHSELAFHGVHEIEMQAVSVIVTVNFLPIPFFVR